MATLHGLTTKKDKNFAIIHVVMLELTVMPLVWCVMHMLCFWACKKFNEHSAFLVKHTVQLKFYIVMMSSC